MQDHYFYDYSIIRVVPKVEREEFLNVGVIVFCHEKDFLDAEFFVDENKLKIFDASINISIVKKHLTAIADICSGKNDSSEIRNLSKREKFHWLTSPKSTIIQTSSVHSGYNKNPKEVLKHLVDTMVKAKNP